MLIEFSVENFLSFKESNTLSLVATKGKEFPENVFSYRLDGAVRARPIPLLKSVAIYGANAGGKTNLLKAVSFMRNFVLHSSKDIQAGEPIPVTRFLCHAGAQDEPSTLEIVFVQNGVRYRYGFSADTEKVHHEWLFAAPKGREAKYFVRDGGAFDFGNAFGRSSRLEEKTRENALFISVAAQFNNQVARNVLEWFSKMQVFTADEQLSPGHSMRILEEKTERNTLLKFIRLADHTISDLGVEDADLSLSDLPGFLRDRIGSELERNGGSGASVKIKKIVSYHYCYDDSGRRCDPVAFDFENESRGTRKFFELAGVILFALKHGSTLVIDELECSLHPKMTRFILKMFHSKTTNPKNAQLVFTTHDLGLFSRNFFRRDQLLMVRKGDFGGSELYSLSDFQVRPDASFDKDYMQGRFGAVPLVMEPDAVFAQKDEEVEAGRGRDNGQG